MSHVVNGGRACAPARARASRVFSPFRPFRPFAGRGFTLIELMITLALLGILSALAVPAFNVWIANSRVRIAGSDLADGLRLAQTESLRRNRQTVFALTHAVGPTTTNYTAVANGNNWAVSIVPLPTDTGASAFVRAGSIADLRQGVTITGPAAICFSSLGRLIKVAETGTGITGASCDRPATPPQIYKINVPGADHPLQVEVGLGGQVRLCNPAQAASPATPEGCEARA